MICICVCMCVCFVFMQMMGYRRWASEITISFCKVFMQGWLSTHVKCCWLIFVYKINTAVFKTHQARPTWFFPIFLHADQDIQALSLSNINRLSQVFMQGANSVHMLSVCCKFFVIQTNTKAMFWSHRSWTRWFFCISFEADMVQKALSFRNINHFLQHNYARS